MSADEVNRLNNCPLQIQDSQHQLRPSGAIANTFVSPMPDRFGQLDDNVARQSPFTELDQHGPWTPLDMGGDKACRSAVTSIQTPWNQHEHGQVLLPSSKTNFSEMGKGNATHRSRSDSGYGTVPHRSPPLRSTEQSVYGGDAPATIPDCASLTNDLNDINFQHPLDFNLDRFEDTSPAAPFQNANPSINLEGMFNPPPENGPFVCTTCRDNGDIKLASLKNKSEWK